MPTHWRRVWTVCTASVAEPRPLFSRAARPEWVQARAYNIVRLVRQCATGQRAAGGRFITEPTQIWAQISEIALVLQGVFVSMEIMSTRVQKALAPGGFGCTPAFWAARVALG
eukprot:4981797-Lingulodinium_polyedra.AAC.1